MPTYLCLYSRQCQLCAYFSEHMKFTQHVRMGPNPSPVRREDESRSFFRVKDLCTVREIVLTGLLMSDKNEIEPQVAS